VYVFTCTHDEFACVCVNIYIQVGRVYMSGHVYLHICTLRLHVWVYVVAYMHAESTCRCVYIFTYMHVGCAHMHVYTTYMHAEFACVCV